jgi:DNA polymerase III delta prime subunit
MDELNINQLLGREENANQIKDFLKNFELQKQDLLLTKGIYVYGEPGTGKSSFVIKLLKELNYDVVKYDAGDVRNKSIIETITKHNMSDKNIMSMFHKKVQKIAIVMDEIDGMNNGDKGGINTLIKLIRPKKTKKQKKEDVTMNPIVCIGNYHIDKKIKELMKVCFVVELKSPTPFQMKNIVNELIPDIDSKIMENMIDYVQSDLRKLKHLQDIYKNDKSIFKNNNIDKIFQMKSYNDDTKKITQKLINKNYSMNEHLTIMNETDRTIVGLLWHENIIDVLSKIDKSIAVPFYVKLLNNMCFSDYIDRITFQKQIWQFNEMSSLIKTFKNNKLFHETFKKVPLYNPQEIRFTKVLTKYSTEYNNSLFIQNLCQQLGMDKKDIFSFFLDLRNKYDDNEITGLLENYEISKLDINRIYRYLEKYTKEDAEDFPDDTIIDDDQCSVQNDCCE